ncbi:PAS domain-containing protein, partial [Aliifodinibius sp. S!AR15-10]|uniref:histidine kinase dimerization/phosphoacceptor domain -containing protein n=1 Tax=Aliifodinibius sp. S!AR15-10 TaxID=2950437 RepID=UPI00285CDA2A
DRDLVGYTAREALPELEGQGFFELLDNVYQTNELHKGKEVPFVIKTDNQEKTYYRNFIYKPLQDEDGECTGIFVEAVDVTKQVENRKRLEKSNEEKQILLSELHHRVKNNLALITGLIELEVEEYRNHLEITSLETTRNRIFTIAEIHEILYQQQSLKKIPFHEFVKRL